jgi:hypothetical protein
MEHVRADFNLTTKNKWDKYYSKRNKYFMAYNTKSENVIHSRFSISYYTFGL